MRPTPTENSQLASFFFSELKCHIIIWQLYKECHSHIHCRLSWDCGESRNLLKFYLDLWLIKSLFPSSICDLATIFQCCSIVVLQIQPLTIDLHDFRCVDHWEIDLDRGCVSMCVIPLCYTEVQGSRTIYSQGYRATINSNCNHLARQNKNYTHTHTHTHTHARTHTHKAIAAYTENVCRHYQLSTNKSNQQAHRSCYNV